MWPSIASPGHTANSSADAAEGNIAMSGSNTFKFVMLPPQSEITRDWGRQLAAAMPEVRVVIAEDQATAEREIVDAEAAFGWLNRDLLAKAKRLRWLQAPQAAPAAGYYYPELIAHPIKVTNFREIFNDHISAHIMAFVLAFARGLHVYIPQQLRREWKKPTEDHGVVHLPEATALIVGVGGIGAETAKHAAAFGMTVLATDARRTSAPAGVTELHKPEALDTLLPRADFVILTVPHTPATEGFMNRARFQRMKRSAFFINIGRGMTTKLDDLVAALNAGEIAGAALDVYEQEPLPANHPLWTMPNVLMTPHMAGYGPYLNDRRYQIITDNCRAFLSDKPLRNVVDKASWF
jgi:phosphoglycerate dehydrogenase-like enzyme